MALHCNLFNVRNLHDHRRHVPGLAANVSSLPTVSFLAATRIRHLAPEGLERKSLTSELKPSMRVAVGIGNRGIANLVEIVTAALNRIRVSRAEPFIVPAMGRHGGATPSGQELVLAEFGITPESTPCALRDEHGCRTNQTTW